MDEVWNRAKANIRLANVVVGEASSVQTKLAVQTRMLNAIEKVLEKCRSERKRKRDGERKRDVSDEKLSQLAVFTDHLPLKDYNLMLHIVPRLVNVVTDRAFPFELTPRSINDPSTNPSTIPLTIPLLSWQEHLRNSNGNADEFLWCAVGRGDPRCGDGTKASSRLASHCESMLKRVLCTSSLRRRPTRI